MLRITFLAPPGRDATFADGLRKGKGLGQMSRRSSSVAQILRQSSQDYGCELLEGRCLLSGVTLITHGFRSESGGWVKSMATAISEKLTDYSLYTITASRNFRGEISVSASARQGGSNPL